MRWKQKGVGSPLMYAFYSILQKIAELINRTQRSELSISRGGYHVAAVENWKDILY